MANVILILGLFVASIFAILSYGLGGAGNSHGFTWVEHGVWMIIVVSAVPAAIEFVKDYLRALRRGLVKLVSRDGLPEVENR